MNTKQCMLVLFLSLTVLLSTDASEHSSGSILEEMMDKSLKDSLLYSIKKDSLAAAGVSDAEMYLIREAASRRADMSYLSRIYISGGDPVRYRSDFHKVENATLWAEKNKAAISIPCDIGVAEFPVSTAYFLLMAKAYTAQQQKNESKKK